ncbi:hypothetical protein OG203_31260 [Nocardia sp. NBC_01499]
MYDALHLTTTLRVMFFGFLETGTENHARLSTVRQFPQAAVTEFLQ